MPDENRKNPMWLNKCANSDSGSPTGLNSLPVKSSENSCVVHSLMWDKLYDSDGELIPVMESDDDTAVNVRNCDVAVRGEYNLLVRHLMFFDNHTWIDLHVWLCLEGFDASNPFLKNHIRGYFFSWTRCYWKINFQMLSNAIILIFTIVWID